MKKIYHLSDFDYELPAERIAKYPLEKRSASKMLVLMRDQQKISHHQFVEFVDFIKSGDLMVFNNTKVIPARLFAEKTTGGRCEILIERLLAGNHLLAHVKASKAPKINSQIFLENQLALTVLARRDDLFELALPGNQNILDVLAEIGHVPLPPYLNRLDEAKDLDRYQTVYAKHAGAVAAPTAGLHFDSAILAQIAQKKIEIAEVTLHVGAGTFQPVRSENLTEHRMHVESLEVNEKTCEQIRQCQARRGRVIAIGTTTVRALETAAKTGEIKPFQGDTDIFIYPGFKFHCVDAMLTNFHLPKSSLLMLVAAFCGFDLMREAYQAAIENHYRFYSYGDCMLII